MKKSKKTIAMVTGLVLGITVLTSASFANYATSNGYDVGKTAFKGLLKNENYSSELVLSMSVDGEKIADFKSTEKYDRNGDVKKNHIEEDMYSGDKDRYESYFQDNSEISVYNKGTENEHAYIYEYGNLDDLGFLPGRGSFDELSNQSEEEAETSSKIIRFAELVADTLVGDLKNNIVYVSGDDNSATYEMELSGMQIPEFVNAGVSLLFSEKMMSNSDDPVLSQIGRDPVIKSVYLTFTVDSENRLTDGKFNVTAAGNGHEAAVDLSLRMYDYGTTKPERVDVSTLKNVDRDTHENEGLYIDTETVDEDGNVLNSDGEAVGTVEINGDGEGVVVYNKQ